VLKLFQLYIRIEKINCKFLAGFSLFVPTKTEEESSAKPVLLWQKPFK
jgi:hypothetical protein